MKNSLHNSLVVLFFSGYLIFTPLINVSNHNAPETSVPSYLHGVGMSYASTSDLTTLGATWYLNWGSCSDSNCVPMTKTGTDPNLSKQYTQPILFLNEPDGGPPTSNATSVSDAIKRYNTQKAEYPHAKWVVGNIVVLQSDWLKQFHNTCHCSPYAWGAHAYFTNPTEMVKVENWLVNLHQATGGNYWITEWADTSGNVSDDKAFYAWMASQPWIQRAAYYTNRVQGIESWYPSGWNVTLFNWADNNLTDIGIWFSETR